MLEPLNQKLNLPGSDTGCRHRTIPDEKTQKDNAKLRDADTGTGSEPGFVNAA